MEKFITVDKMSKKARKEYYSKKRNTWGEVNPTTRVMASVKTYNRKRAKSETLMLAGL